MYINWEGPLLTVNPKFGTDLQGNPPKGIKIPTYGHFGGPQIFGQEGGPVDSLDTLFASHDGLIAVASNNGQEVPTSQELVEAHAQLIGDIIDLAEGQTTLDPEATLYTGFTIFALTAQVAQFDDLDGLALLDDYLDPGDKVPLDDVSAALTKAAEYMETGLEAVPKEGKGLNGLFHIWEKQFDALIA
jgi:hypothetical protein